MTTSVYVSGASGFIAQHVVQQLIEKGYHVVGSVRSKAKGELLVSQFGSSFEYEIVEDIAKSGAFDESLKKHPEVTVFLHTASPFHFEATDIEKELYIPALEGTTNALKAIEQYGQLITRVVVTSSFAALINLDRESDPTLTYTEEDWNPLSKEDGLKNAWLGYVVSKKLAEKVAWDFVKEAKPKFDLTVVNPTYVYGPQAFQSGIKDKLNTSAELINSALKMGPNDEVPPVTGPYIDVRDVAAAHLVAFEKDEAKNQRLVMADGRFTYQDFLDIIHKHFPQLSKNLPVGKPGSSKEQLANSAKLNFSKTEKILGFKYIGLEQSVVDSVKQIVETEK